MEKLVIALMSEHKIGVRGQSELVIDGKRFRKNFPLSNNLFKMALEHGVDVQNPLELQTRLFDDIMLYMDKHKKSLAKQKLAEKLESRDPNDSLLGYTKMLVINRKDEYVMIDNETQQINDLIVTKHVDSMVLAELDGDKNALAQWKAENEKAGYIDYNPEVPKRLFNKDGILFFNLYEAPAWQKLTEHENNKKYPEEFTRFMDHLFVGDDDKFRARAYLVEVIRGRCFQHLVLHGARGTGKSSFAQYLTKSLVGENNFALGETEQLLSSFSYNLDNVKVKAWEECDYSTPKAKAKFKNYVNKKASFEQKHRDISKAKTLRASHIILNNKASHNNLTLDDRNFLVPDMVNKKVELTYGNRENFYQGFIKLCDDVDWIARVGFALINEFKGTKHPLPTDNYYSENYQKLIVYSLSKFKRFAFIMMCNSPEGEKVFFADIKKAFRKSNNMNGTSTVFRTMKELFKSYCLRVGDVFEVLEDDQAFIRVGDVGEYDDDDDRE